MKIVLTGGPSAGKTSIAEILVKEYVGRFCLVPEAASLLYRGGFPRVTRTNLRRYQQRAIYYVQRELEALGSADLHGRSMICDRGSLDSLAYWPENGGSFMDSVGSDLRSELDRYDWVLHLDTSDALNYQVNSLRIETNEEALQINERIKRAWSAHPKRFIIGGADEFINKVNHAVKIVGEILDGREYQVIKDDMARSNPDAPIPRLHLGDQVSATI